MQGKNLIVQYHFKNYIKKNYTATWQFLHRSDDNHESYLTINKKIIIIIHAGKIASSFKTFLDVSKHINSKLFYYFHFKLHF